MYPHLPSFLCADGMTRINNNMNLVLQAPAAVTMTSREIADLTDKRHDNVMRTIEVLHEKGVIALPQFEEVPNLGLGPLLLKQYRIGKRDSFVIVAQLSPEFTARLVDRWQELESVAEKPRELSTLDILTLAMESEKGRLVAVEQLAIAAPKVEFVDRYVDATGLKGFRQVAKLLSIKEPEFRAFLSAHDIMYMLGGEWHAFQNHIDAGRFSEKTGVAEGSGHAYNTCKFTPKGIAWIAGLMASKRASAALEVAAP